MGEQGLYTVYKPGVLRQILEFFVSLCFWREVSAWRLGKSR